MAALSSCAVRVKNTEWCGDMGADGAACFNTHSDDSRIISSGEWETERFGMLCTKAANFAEIKKTILRLCKITARCTYDTKHRIIKFQSRVNGIVNSTSDYKLVDFSSYTVDDFDRDVEDMDL